MSASFNTRKQQEPASTEPRGEAAQAQDEESVVADQGEAPGRLWDMPGLPRARQGAGGAGIIALEAD